MNDNGPVWFTGAHPSAFPYNKGGFPPGMSLILGQVHHPTLPIAAVRTNTGLLIDLFNIIQRHTVSAQATANVPLHPEKISEIANLTESQCQSVLDAVASGAFGDGLRSIMDPLPPGAWILYRGIKSAGGRTVGSPQSFIFRTRCSAVHALWGHYIVQLEPMPFEKSSEWTFTSRHGQTRQRFAAAFFFFLSSTSSVVLLHHRRRRRLRRRLRPMRQPSS